MAVLFYLLVFLFILLAGLLCLVILVQESKSMGLGASFGGDVSTSMFGTSTADVLKKFTAMLAAAFLILCFILSLWTSSLGRASRGGPAATIESVENGL
jgi:preprotein translocase subunit SecG